jgi:hypothetical protein
MVRHPSAATLRAPILMGWVLGLACFVYLMTLPPTLGLADESYMLYGSKRIVLGQAIYHEFFDFLTPFSYYLYAMAYAIGGVSITSARVTTALSQALCATCTYFLSLQLASMAEAILAGLLVVVICVPVWNMGSHHWISTAFGLATAAVLLAPRWAQSTRARPAVAGALAGLAVCTTTSRGLWLLLWLGIVLPVIALVRGDADRWRRCLRELAWAAVGGAAVCVPVLGYALWRSSFAEMVYSTFTWVFSHYGGYRLPWMGGEKQNLLWAVAHPTHTLPWLFRAVPTLLGVEAAALLWALWREGLGAQLVRAALVLLAVSAIGGISYFPDPVHVAFVLPFVLVVLAGMVYRTRTAFAWSEMPGTTQVVRFAWLVLVALVLLKGWRNARFAWQEHPILYETAFGTLAGDVSQRETIRDLRRQLAVGGEPPHLFAYPGDAWIYLALPAENPTRFAHLFVGTGYNTPEQIGETMDRLKNDPKAAVLVNTRFGNPGDPFGAFLKEHYRHVVDIGPPPIQGQPLYRLYLPGNQDQ